MADQSRRTTILLTVVAILFILTIIILCLPYDLGHKKHPSKEKVQSDEIHTSTSTTNYPTPRRTSIKGTTATTPSTTTSTDIVSKSFSTTSTLSSILSTSSTATSTGIVSKSVVTNSTLSSILSTPSTLTRINTTASTTQTTPIGQTDSTGTSVTEDVYQNYSNGTTTGKYLSSTETTTKYYINIIGETETTTSVPDEATLQEETPTPTVVETEATTTPVITTPTTSTTLASTTPASTSTTMLPTPDPFLDEPECNKTECKDFSAKMWLLRDNNADPCEDFYQYACGAIVDSPSQTPVDAGEAVKRKIRGNILDDDNEAYAVARDFYTSCLHQDPVNAGKQWPNTRTWMDEQIPTSTSCDKDELTNMIAQLLKNHFSPLFDVSLGLDNEGQFITRMTPPINRYPFSDDIAQQYCLKQYKLGVLEESYIDVEHKYEEYLNCKFQTDGIGMEARLYFLELNLKQLGIQGQNATEAVDFFKEISELKKDPFTSEDLLQLDYQTFDLDNFKQSNDNINWNKLLSELFNTTSFEGMQIQIYGGEYIHNITGLLSNHLSVCEILGTLWKESRYMDLVSPQSTLTPYSEEYCLDLTTTLLPELLYSNDDTLFSTNATDKVSESIMTMKISSQRNRAITAENKALQIYNQTQIVNSTFSIFGNHSEIMSSHSNYQMKSLLLLQRLRSVLYNQLFRRYVDDKDYYLHMYQAFENAAFHPENKYYSGASYLLEEPYYTEYEPAYLSYPGLGAAMARTAIRNHQGQDEDRSCVIQEELKGYKDSNVTMKVNLSKLEFVRKFSKMVWDGYSKGKNLASKNMTAYLTQRDFAPLPWFDMTPEQLFYLKSAQIHCEATSELDLMAVKERGHIPGPIRVNAVLMNEPGFRRAFECPPQERIRTEELCTGH